MACVFFEVLYNDEGASALRVQLAGPIVLTGWLLQYGRRSLGALLRSTPEQTTCLYLHPLLLFVLLPSTPAKPSCILSQR